MSDDFGTFPKKWAKFLKDDSDWKSKAEGSSEDDLDSIIVECSKTVTNTEKDMDADEDLKHLKEQVKATAAIYTDVIKLHQARNRYCVYLLNSR
jgi:hypothetical protein